MITTEADVISINCCEVISGQYVDVVSPSAKNIVLGDIAWSLSRQARFAGHTKSEEIWNVAQHSCFVTKLLELSLINKPSICDSLNLWLIDHGFKSWGIDKASIRNSLNLWLIDRGFSPHAINDIDLLKVLRGAILHDSPETYLVDLPSPVKRHPALRAPYKDLENGLMAVINEAFNLSPLSSIEEELITWADLLALRIEAYHLMPSRGNGWTALLPVMTPNEIKIFPKVKPWRPAFNEFMQYTNKLGLLNSSHSSQ